MAAIDMGLREVGLERDGAIQAFQPVFQPVQEGQRGAAIAVRHGESRIERQGTRLLTMGCAAVLIKGGHGKGAESIDYLFTAGGTFALFDRLVLSKLRAAMGGEVKYAVSGSAPLGLRLGHFYRSVGLDPLRPR